MIDDKRLPLKKDYLLYLEEVPTHKFASKAIKISEDTGKRWRDEDQDFADECEAKIAAWLRKTMRRTKPEFQIERLLKEDFSQRAEVFNEDQRPIPILFGISSMKPLDQQEFIRRVEEIRKEYSNTEVE